MPSVKTCGSRSGLVKVSTNSNLRCMRNLSPRGALSTFREHAKGLHHVTLASDTNRINRQIRPDKYAVLCMLRLAIFQNTVTLVAFRGENCSRPDFPTHRSMSLEKQLLKTLKFAPSPPAPVNPVKIRPPTTTKSQSIQSNPPSHRPIPAKQSKTSA